MPTRGMVQGSLPSASQHLIHGHGNSVHHTAAVVARSKERQRLQTAGTVAFSSNSGKSGPSHGAGGEQQEWNLLGFPSYLQKTSARPFPCEEPPEVQKDGGKQWRRERVIWQDIRHQAQLDAAKEPLLSSFMYASILAHDSFEKSLAFVLANRLANTTLLPTQLFEIFLDVLQGDDDVRCGALADVEAVRERDPACLSLLQPLLYNKGYHAIQTHRIAHALWTRGQQVMALALQSRSSEVFAVDIHPAARIGKGILLDHGTGVVIGETAVLGDNCSLLQNITLGGTGKETGDRHPKIGNNVLIGANATVLGNIRIGNGAQIAAGSLVLKAVDPCTMVAGSPAKEVGKVQGNPAQTMWHWTQECPPCGPPEQQPQSAVAPQQTQQPQERAPTPKPTEAEAAKSNSVTAQQDSKTSPEPAAAPSDASGSPKTKSSNEKQSQTPPQHWPHSRQPVTQPVLPGEGI